MDDMTRSGVMSSARRDLWLGLGIAAFAVVLLLYAVPYGVDVPSGTRSAVLSPAFWPKFIAWFTLAMGVGLVIQSVIAERINREGEPVEPTSRAGTLRVITAFVLLVIYYWAIHYLGIVVSSVLAIVVFGYLCRPRHQIALLATALLLPLLLWAFFTKMAGVPLHNGVWLGWP